jgi:hypothetical protein
MTHQEAKIVLQCIHKQSLQAQYFNQITDMMKKYLSDMHICYTCPASLRQGFNRLATLADNQYPNLLQKEIEAQKALDMLIDGNPDVIPIPEPKTSEAGSDCDCDKPPIDG